MLIIFQGYSGESSRPTIPKPGGGKRDVSPAPASSAASSNRLSVPAGDIRSPPSGRSAPSRNSAAADPCHPAVWIRGADNAFRRMRRLCAVHKIRYNSVKYCRTDKVIIKSGEIEKKILFAPGVRIQFDIWDFYSNALSTH